MVGEQAEVAVGGDEGEDPLGFPPLEPDTRVEADVVQQPRILGDGGREAECAGSEGCQALLHFTQTNDIATVSHCVTLSIYHCYSVRHLSLDSTTTVLPCI